MKEARYHQPLIKPDLTPVSSFVRTIFVKVYQWRHNYLFLHQYLLFLVSVIVNVFISSLAISHFGLITERSLTFYVSITYFNLCASPNYTHYFCWQKRKQHTNYCLGSHVLRQAFWQWDQICDNGYVRLYIRCEQWNYV